MIKKIKNIFYVVFFFAFAGLVINYYFSDKNIKKTNMSRTFYLSNQNNNLSELQVLKNDTNNIIEYSDDVELYKKNKKKYTFWCLIKKCPEKQ